VVAVLQMPSGTPDDTTGDEKMNFVAQQFLAAVVSRKKIC